MFEIPDDDDDAFWNDVDVSLTANSVIKEKENCPMLRVPQSTCVANTVKSLCTGSRFNQEVTSPNISSPSSVPSDQRSPLSTDNDKTGHDRLNISNQGSTSSRLDDGVSLPGTTHGGNVRTAARDRIGQARRKRKFPGPAGMLPQLGPGQGLNMLSSASPAQMNHQRPQEEVVIQSSQNSEDMFSDVPWQTLMADLGEDGAILMKRFSIANILLNAGKKQLHHGKALFVIGGIDGLESHGNEASITIKDKSGKMQGTIHRDLLKEYESELQPGTVLVLKQVSIISVSQRNHYLNITPTNMVALYHNRGDTLKSLKFHGSQDSLRSVLIALEGAATSRRQSLDASLTLTPGSHSGTSNLSGRGSTVGTPVRKTSNTPLNQRLFSRESSPSVASLGSPSINNVRLTSPSVRDVRLTSPSVRDVSVVNNPGAMRSCTSNNINFNNNIHKSVCADGTKGPLPTTPGTPLSATGSLRMVPQNLNTAQQNISALRAPANKQIEPAVAGGNPDLGRMQSPSLTQTFGLGGQLGGVSGHNVSVSRCTVGQQNFNMQQNTNNSLPSTPVASLRSNQQTAFNSPSTTNSKWKFKSPTVNKKLSPPTSATNSTLVPSQSGARQCQLVPNREPIQLTNQRIQNGGAENVTMETNAIEVSRMSKTLNNNTIEKKNQQTEVEDLWEDDLSDELLSQL